jgi:hypothetical protein
LYWHNTRKVLLSKEAGQPPVRGIRNSYCAGVVADSQQIYARAAGTGGQERRTLPRWGSVVAAPVACREALAAEVLEHTMAIAVVVAHKVAFAVGRDNSGTGAALHTGWVAVAGLPGLFHSLCKIVDRR